MTSAETTALETTPASEEMLTVPVLRETAPDEVAASYARHYAALLAQEEPDTPGWQFVFGQLSAAATLTNALRGR